MSRHFATTRPDIPTELPAAASIAGLVVAGIGVALSLRYRRRTAPETSTR